MEIVEITFTWKVVFIIIAVIHTYFFTRYAFKIHSTPESILENQTKVWKIYQYFFNFISAAFAWLILWIVLPKWIYYINNQSYNLLSLKDIIIAFIVLLGLSSYFPLTLYSIAKSFSELAKKNIRVKATVIFLELKNTLN